MSEQPDSHKTDRPRGFLTESDREFLLEADKTAMKDGTVYSKRHRIRERFTNAILDMSLLFAIDPDDREAVLPGDDTSDELKAGALAFNQILSEQLGTDAIDLFIEAIRSAIVKDYVAKGYYYEPDIRFKDLNRQREREPVAVSLEMLAERYRDGQELKPEVVMILEEHNYI